MNGDSGVSKRMLRLLDKEQLRNRFFAAMAEAIQFEYTASPSMVSLSAWGAKKPGLDEIIPNPRANERLLTVLGQENWDQLSALFRASTPEAPEVKLDCLLHYGGGPRWNRVVLRSMWSDDDQPQLEGALGTVVDIHDSHATIEELALKAARDSLTGLLNRASACEQIEPRLLERPESNFALAIFDLDHFKTANDTYGHEFGDKVLKQVAHDLTQSIRATDISCRMGGDEFLVFLEYKTDIERTIDRIFHAICGPCDEFEISVSMGIALAHEGGSYDMLFHAADQALYDAKRAGRSRYRFFRSQEGGSDQHDGQ